MVDRPGLEKASCECYAIVKARFDAFLSPPATAVQETKGGETGLSRRTVRAGLLAALCVSIINPGRTGWREFLETYTTGKVRFQDRRH